MMFHRGKVFGKSLNWQHGVGPVASFDPSLPLLNVSFWPLAAGHFRNFLVI